VTDNQTEREQVLELLTTRLSSEDTAAIMEEPTDEEIEWVVRDMKKEKAPGIDGVTTRCF
jgi:hypothetical protein